MQFNVCVSACVKKHVIKLIKLLWEAGKIVKPVAPILHDLTLRGFGNFHISERTANTKIRDAARTQKHSAYMANVRVNPHKYSPKVLFPGRPVPSLLGGHSQGGHSVLSRNTKLLEYREFSLCKYPVALVEWDPVF
jgi:hypothetical protein